MRPGRVQFRNSHLSSESFPHPPSSKPPRGIVFVDEAVQTAKADKDRTSSINSTGREPAQCEPFPSPLQSEAQDANADGEVPSIPKSTGPILSWPVESEQEAFLMRHFVTTVSHFFDFSDPRRHFARVAPQRARSNGTLANAIFALSARHLSRTSTFDAYVADVYYQRCLQQLIPTLACEVQDESLLVAAVLLRLMEEIDVPISGADLQCHLLGTQAIVRAQEHWSFQQAAGNGLLQAAHWAALRQDLYIAFATQRPMLLSNLDFFRTFHQCQDQTTSTDLASSDEEDAKWANLSVLQCCDVAQFVFGASKEYKHEYQRLKTVNIDWRRCKPSSFEPFYRLKSTPQCPIPDVRLLMDWHVMGHVYNLLACVLLETNNPLNLRNEDLEAASVESTMREIIGIAIHNPNTPSAHLVASMAIAMCGHTLTSDSEISSMRHILAETERVHGWPTRSAQLSSHQ